MKKRENTMSEKIVITCPNCKIQYYLEKEKLSSPKKLKCLNCNNIWLKEAIEKDDIKNKKIELAPEHASIKQSFEIEKNKAKQKVEQIHNEIIKPIKKNPSKAFSTSVSWIMKLAIIANIGFWGTYFIKYLLSTKNLCS